MKFTTTLPYRRPTYGAVRIRPETSHYTVVSEEVGKSVTVSFEQGVCKDGFGWFAHHPSVITVGNVDAVLELVAGVLSETRVPKNDKEMAVVSTLLSCKDWSFAEENHDMLHGQVGWGFMGGTGCGQLVHKLMYTKVLGVKPEHTGVRRALAAMQFNGWLGQVKAIRAESKHLRDSVTEDELFVTWNAHPICQNSVKYHDARGFLVRAANETHCSCTNCADKLGITANRKRNGIAIETPNVMQAGPLTFTYTKVTKTSAVLKVTTTEGALVDRKTLNSIIKERGQRLVHSDPRGIPGIWYVEALKDSTADTLVLKMERGPKDAMFAQAMILVDKGLLLQKGA